MLHPAPTSPFPQRLKHASGYVLHILTEYAHNGICTLSYEDISTLSGYCPRAVKVAVRKLVAENRIRITKQPFDRRNSYEVCDVSTASA
jgi:hypothetical protein